MMLHLACLCGARSEVPEGTPLPLCWKCGDRMYVWKRT